MARYTSLIVIEMLLPIFHGFLDKCDKSWREYATLANGVIVHKDNPGIVAQICCDLIDANKLLVLAAEAYPEAVQCITSAILAESKSD